MAPTEFLRNRDLVWLLFGFQPGQQLVDSLPDVRHVLHENRRRSIFARAIFQRHPRVRGIEYKHLFPTKTNLSVRVTGRGRRKKKVGRGQVQGDSRKVNPKGQKRSHRRVDLGPKAHPHITRFPDPPPPRATLRPFRLRPVLRTSGVNEGGGVSMYSGMTILFLPSRWRCLCGEFEVKAAKQFRSQRAAELRRFPLTNVVAGTRRRDQVFDCQEVP